MMEQFEYIKDNPKEAEAVLKTVREEMEGHELFAKYAFKVLAGQENVENMKAKKIIQIPYVAWRKRSLAFFLFVL